MPNILLVEDEPLWQQGITLLLNAEDDFNLIHVVDNADDAEIIFEAQTPDILLIDWKIKGNRDGLELAAKLSSKATPNRIILVTGSPPDQIPPHPYRYVPKPQIAIRLVEEIRAAMIPMDLSKVPSGH